MLQLHLTSKAWQEAEPEAEAGSEEASAAEVMGGWSVEETAGFLESRDLCGPAEVCRANGMSGAGLLSMTTTVLVQDLRLMPFAVR